MVSPFVKINNEKWVLPISFLATVLGFMFAATWITKENRQARISMLSPEQGNRISENSVDLDKVISLQGKVVSLQREVESLRKKETALQGAISKTDQGSDVINDQLQDAKVFGGITELEGPGVKVTLRDNNKTMPEDADLIHDIDVLRVTNELFASGAEAISVNGQRLVSTSRIRCAGTTILVDEVKVASPFIISAIGDPNLLYPGFTMPGGVMAEIASASPSMVQISREKSIRIPAYLGSTAVKFGAVPKVTKK